MPKIGRPPLDDEPKLLAMAKLRQQAPHLSLTKAAITVAREYGDEQSHEAARRRLTEKYRKHEQAIKARLNEDRPKSYPVSWPTGRLRGRGFGPALHAQQLTTLASVASRQLQPDVSPSLEVARRLKDNLAPGLRAAQAMQETLQAQMEMVDRVTWPSKALQEVLDQCNPARGSVFEIAQGGAIASALREINRLDWLAENIAGQDSFL